jgi:hypothetical protein
MIYYLLCFSRSFPELLPIQASQKPQASSFISAASAVMEQTSEIGLIPKYLIKIA